MVEQLLDAGPSLDTPCETGAENFDEQGVNALLGELDVVIRVQDRLIKNKVVSLLIGSKN